VWQKEVHRAKNESIAKKRVSVQPFKEPEWQELLINEISKVKHEQQQNIST
jgi:hypothetical protein